MLALGNYYYNWPAVYKNDGRYYINEEIMFVVSLKPGLSKLEMPVCVTNFVCVIQRHQTFLKNL